MISKEVLEECVRNNKSIKQIAKELKTSKSTVKYALGKYGIERQDVRQAGRKPIDLTNQRFGKLVVKELVTKRGSGTRWRCECDCGNKSAIIYGPCLRNGGQKSCGCEVKKAGKDSVFWKGYEEISGGFWMSLTKRASFKNHEFGVSMEFIWNLFIKQNRTCAISGLPLSFAKNFSRDKQNQTASLDRIDSSKGYSEDNVQWVHKRINIMKMDLSDSEFIKYCKIVANNN